MGDMSRSFFSSASAFLRASFGMRASLIFFSISSRSAPSSISPSSFWIAFTCSFR
jgi:hypothetical protein